MAKHKLEHSASPSSVEAKFQQFRAKRSARNVWCLVFAPQLCTGKGSVLVVAALYGASDQTLCGVISDKNLAVHSSHSDL